MSNQDYQRVAERHNQAFDAFRSMYATRLPPPVQRPMPGRPAVERENLVVPLTLVVLIMASILVSGSRTVSEFGFGVIGLMGVIMIEGAIIGLSFYRTRTNFNEARIEHVRAWANWGLRIALGVAIAANLHAVLKETDFIPANSPFEGAILVMLAVSAPVLAFISGDILAIETMRISVKRRRIEEQYQIMVDEWRREHEQALQTWTVNLNAEWSRSKKQWGVSVDLVQPEQLSSNVHLSNGQSIGQAPGQPVLPAASTIGHTKTPNATELAEQYFTVNPDALNLPARQVAQMIGVGKSTVANVQARFKSQLAGDGQNDGQSS